MKDALYLQSYLRQLHSYNMTRGDKFEIFGIWLAYLATDSPKEQVIISLQKRVKDGSWDNHNTVRDYIAALINN